MLDKMAFEEQLKAMDERALLEFLARQQWEMNNLCDSHEKQLESHHRRIKTLENSDRRLTLVGSVIAAGVSLVINVGSWFVKRQ